jgi:predicted lipoprotein with Yx(FWY)xxD motif
MRLKTGILAIVLVAAACGGDDSASSAETTLAPPTAAPETTAAAPATTAAPETTAAPTSAAATVSLGNTSLGDILVDSEGNTLYLFVPDAQGASVCYEDCAAAWPPLVGDVTAGDGIDSSLLGSVERDDGTVQASYNDWPLYYFANDAVPGDTNGQGLNEVWFVLTASGDGVGLGNEASGAADEIVALGATELGDILVDSEGNTLYLFTPDAQGASTCYDSCADAWPPLVGEVAAGDSVDSSLLGSVERDDGTVQASYNGWPLYYFANDAVPGDTNGQGLNQVWYVLTAAGDAVTG